MVEKRTDLAIEARESFPEDNVEIKGVVLDEKIIQDGCIRISTVNITNEHGAELMKKPVGNYVTIEFTDKSKYMDDKNTKEFEEKVSATICSILGDMVRDKKEKAGQADNGSAEIYMVTGLGNRFATPDALGPVVMEKVMVNRHMVREFGKRY